MSNAMYRQGDVLVLRVDGPLPEVESEKTVSREIVLAYGEVTGHAHRLSYKPNKARIAPVKMPAMANDRLMTLDEAARLLHEEHGAIDLPAGNYIVRQQREYSPLENRTVAD